MRTYSVSAAAFFSQSANQKLADYFAANAARCQTPMQQLISAAGLRGKAILSIGAKIGHEEVWFHAEGCRLSLCDLDEHGDIEPILKSLPAGGDLTYYIGDARLLPQSAQSAVLYLSSFTPDELYKREVRRKHLSISRYILRRVGITERDFSWPKGCAPFHPMVGELCERLLSPDGTLIVQSYAAPIRADDERYVSAVEQQLQSMGMRSAGIYYQKHLPSTHLIVGCRLPVKLGPISRIHGRGENQNDEVVSHFGLSGACLTRGARALAVSPER